MGSLWPNCTEDGGEGENEGMGLGVFGQGLMFSYMAAPGGGF